MSMPANEREVLRKLAGQVAELASRPVEAEKRDLWYRHNALQPTRPVIFCDPENSWNEIIPPEKVECQSRPARSWELRLRKFAFWGAELCDDRVIEPFFDVPYVYKETGWGLEEKKIGGHDGGSYTWEAPLRSYTDMAQLNFPEITIDEDATNKMVDLAQSTFGDLLTVRPRTFWWWTLGMTWTLVNLRGLEQIMLDMMDEPDNFHRLMAFLRDGHLAKLDYLERNNLLSLNNRGDYVGSGGFGWTQELPQPGFADNVRTKDMWGFLESQETVGVSPGMFAEFVFPYQLPLLERFGLNCYGCCEPLDERWDTIKTIPRLRRVSIGPWSNRAVMAEKLGGNYVFSMKPSPTDLAMERFDEEKIRMELRRDLEITRNCRVEVIMKDTHTIRSDPRRVIRWTQIAREEAEKI